MDFVSSGVGCAFYFWNDPLVSNSMVLYHSPISILLFRFNDENPSRSVGILKNEKSARYNFITLTVVCVLPN